MKEHLEKLERLLDAEGIQVIRPTLKVDEGYDRPVGGDMTQCRRVNVDAGYFIVPVDLDAPNCVLEECVTQVLEEMGIDLNTRSFQRFNYVDGIDRVGGKRVYRKKMHLYAYSLRPSTEAEIEAVTAEQEAQATA